MVSESREKPMGKSSRERAHDDLVMSTNRSSIVSKRSVERIYYPNEPHFFRFFVKKFQRRAPLINRGYHLRLQVIDIAVRNFLERHSEKTKVVINLGCGSDVLPWQCMTRYPDLCKHVTFIDVDFPDLMDQKHRVVQDTPELNSMLTGITHDKTPFILLQSDQYVQIGCDLRQLGSIKNSLSTVVNMDASEFMFVAEVSITYMETDAADSVIEWANGLGEAEFCLLEQILPDGADHPFAETMLRHFEKLKTPLKSVFSYPDLRSQRGRFLRLGWPQVDVESLWTSWSSGKYLSSEERCKLDDVEPFDEWEEFAIFASHYCIVIATNHSETSVRNDTRAHLGTHLDAGKESVSTTCSLAAATGFGGLGKKAHRRFGAPMSLVSQFGTRLLADVFGLGNASRLRSLDLFTSNTIADFKMTSAGPSSRMCHTVSDLGFYGNLLVGGRGSPSSPLKDCWIFDKARRCWQRVHDLPKPLYRHTMTRLGDSNMALVVGGKTGPSSIFSGCLLYHPDDGWAECEILGPSFEPVFGAILVSFDIEEAGSGDDVPSKPMKFRGILAGGLRHDGTVARQILSWTLEVRDASASQICFSPLANSGKTDNDGRSISTMSLGDCLGRFGASAMVDTSGHLLVVGGIVQDRVLPKEQEIIVIDVTGPSFNVVASSPVVPPHDLSGEEMPRPLLVGMSVVATEGKRAVIMGGGATCFSMGTYWNRGCYTVVYDLQTTDGVTATSRSRTVRKWRFHQTFELTDGASAAFNLAGGSTETKETKARILKIPRVRLESSDDFAKILSTGTPVVIEQCDLGPCVERWSRDHLVEVVGEKRQVIVHSAASRKMDFKAKNFNYVSKSFGAFMREVEDGGKMYLRSLSEERPAGQPANLSDDFPGLAGEFHLPDELTFVTRNTFSSVLRVSGPVDMWLHYDVMANIYCQIVGSKRMILFPPSDVCRLSFAPGASSSSLDVFAELESPSLAGTHPHEAILQPGHVLFLPPLWLHAAAPLTNLGVAVNVFFRNLESGYSSGRDVYGNRDLVAYEKGRQDVARTIKSFDKVPADMREFYVRRLADELLQKLAG